MNQNATPDDETIVAAMQKIVQFKKEETKHLEIILAGMLEYYEFKNPEQLCVTLCAYMILSETPKEKVKRVLLETALPEYEGGKFPIFAIIAKALVTLQYMMGFKAEILFAGRIYTGFFHLTDTALSLLEVGPELLLPVAKEFEKQRTLSQTGDISSLCFSIGLGRLFSEIVKKCSLPPVLPAEDADTYIHLEPTVFTDYCYEHIYEKRE